MMKVCGFCQGDFEITEEDIQFYAKISPLFNNQKSQIPPPTLCPDCRQQRRLAWRNERFLYNHTCDLCKKEIISLYSPVKNLTVYCRDCWWSDQWDPLSYGKNIDSDRPLFAQIQELLLNVPKLGMLNINSQNSDYCLFSSDLKDCYLVFSAVGSEDCLYGHQCNWNKDCVDVTFCYNSELCYEAVDCRNCYHSQYIQNCERCTDCQFCYGCQGCSDCFLCVNLNNKQYCIENKQYTKEEYEKKLKELYSQPNFLEATKDKLRDLKQKSVHKFAHVVQCENCTGDYLRQCRNCRLCFDAINLEDSAYIWTSPGAKDSMDCCYIGKQSELSYEGMSVFPGYHLLFTDYCWDSSDVFYSSLCMQSKNCFACVGLKKKEYCILNKQYTKEEYENLVPKIVEQMKKTGEWGEFFPSSLSPFGYNETVAQEGFSLSKEEAIQKGFNWSDYESPKPEVKKIIPASKLPANIKDIPDDILNWAIECEVTHKPFRVVKQELQFYRDNNVPIPRKHPDQRHKDRTALRNPKKLWSRNCMKCQASIQTTYSPDRPERVYCERCYLEEVY